MALHDLLSANTLRKPIFIFIFFGKLRKPIKLTKCLYLEPNNKRNKTLYFKPKINISRKKKNKKLIFTEKPKINSTNSNKHKNKKSYQVT